MMFKILALSAALLASQADSNSTDSNSVKEKYSADDIYKLVIFCRGAQARLKNKDPVTYLESLKLSFAMAKEEAKKKGYVLHDKTLEESRQVALSPWFMSEQEVLFVYSKCLELGIGKDE